MKNEKKNKIKKMKNKLKKVYTKVMEKI